jgi:hypothetical protein
VQTYEKTFTQEGRNQHARIVQWLDSHVAFISEEKEFNRFAILSKREGLLIGITFHKASEMFTIQFLNVTNLTPAQIATVYVYTAYRDLANTEKRVRAAVEMLKGF